MRNCVVLTVTDEHGARPGHSRSPMRCHVIKPQADCPLMIHGFMNGAAMTDLFIY